MNLNQIRYDWSDMSNELKNALYASCNIEMLSKARDNIIKFLMIILQWYLRLNMYHFIEKDSKY